MRRRHGSKHLKPLSCARYALAAAVLWVVCLPAQASADSGSIFAGGFRLVDDLQDALEDAEDEGELSFMAATKLGDWVVVTPEAARYSRSIHWYPRYLINYAINLGATPRAVSFWDDRHCVLILDGSAVSYGNLAGIDRLQNFVESRGVDEPITAFAIQPGGGGWAIATDRDYLTFGVDQQVEDALNDTFASQRVPSAMSFGPQGAFVLAAGMRIITIGLAETPTREHLAGYQREGQSLDHVMLAPNGGVAVYSKEKAPDEGTTIDAIERGPANLTDNGVLWQRMEAFGLAGLSIAFWDDGDVVARSYGVSRTDQDTPILIDTPFVWMSISKYLTGLFCAMLEENGLLDLTDTLQKHVNRYQGGEVDLWLRQMPPSARRAALYNTRIDRFLAHTSGLTRAGASAEDDFPQNPPPISAGEWLRGSDVDGEYTRPYVTAVKDPETVYHYSNAGYQVAAAVIEDITGMLFEDAIQAWLFNTLGMDGAFLATPSPPGLREMIAWPHRDNGSRRASRFDIAWAAPAGMAGSALDYLPAMVPFVNGGLDMNNNPLLAPETMDNIAADHTGPASGLTYGLGVFRVRSGRILRHTGGHKDGYVSRMEIDRDKRRAIVLLANRGDRTGVRNILMRQLIQQFMDAPVR